MNDFTPLKETIKGAVITPTDPTYSKVSDVLMHAGAPAVVIQPADTDDIARAIAFATQHTLTLSIRSGGHSGAGFGTNVGGLVIDLSTMNRIDIIDATAGRVRIEPGAHWGDVAKTLESHGLAISSGDTATVGVGGLTLGGGIGWMVRKYGLAIDSLVAAEIVTADGQLLRTSTTEYDDLFWAIRGGGGNFGVVTAFEFVAHPISTVYGGTITYVFKDIATLLRGWREYMRTAPEELTTMFLLMPPMGEGPAMAMILCCYAGNNDQAAMDATNPLLDIGHVLQHDIHEQPYSNILGEAHAFGDMDVIAKNVFVDTFSDELVSTIAALYNDAGNGPILQLRSLGGAFSHVASDATAFPHRQSELLIVGPTFTAKDASKADIAKAMVPWNKIAEFGSGAYANLLSTATSKDIADAYPRHTYDRLSAIKKIYDPQNTFNQNHNVKP
jgi:FAD/FMN-containing dehydrogenase